MIADAFDDKWDSSLVIKGASFMLHGKHNHRRVHAVLSTAGVTPLAQLFPMSLYCNMDSAVSILPVVRMVLCHIVEEGSILRNDRTHDRDLVRIFCL